MRHSLPGDTQVGWPQQEESHLCVPGDSLHHIHLALLVEVRAEPSVPPALGGPSQLDEAKETAEAFLAAGQCPGTPKYRGLSRLCWSMWNLHCY